MTHHKAKTFLEVNISDAAVSFEEPLHILLSGRWTQPADENTTAAHVNDVLSAKTGYVKYSLRFFVVLQPNDTMTRQCQVHLLPIFVANQLASHLWGLATIFFKPLRAQLRQIKTTIDDKWRLLVVW